ncbi:patatin-like phospholipase family protein [Orrella sp. JC864]|uniref:patatin-like phospholipase family protein n=1 Tax=Orrella sp. JC864 TaxID=3120298 RepID=UPI003008754F
MPIPPVDGIAARPGRRPLTGLVLTGGGARAAYQVGALQAIVELLDPSGSPGLANPFPIICGTSAGSINAAALACRADDPRKAVRRTRVLWEGLRTGQIYRSDAAGLLHSGACWLGLLALGWLMPGRQRAQPRSLLDNTPLRRLLESVLDFGRLQANIDRGALSALAITASGYTSGEHLTFYQASGGIAPWRRSLRRAVPDRLHAGHLMASSAIPFIFPAHALRVGGQLEWCGDGSMRQLAPISPAVHLGADRVLVIGTGHRDDTHPEQREDDPPYPSLAQIGGHALSNIFLDSVSTDVERLERVNGFLRAAPGAAQATGLRPVQALALGPSRSLDEMAMAHLGTMPRAVRTLFRVLGISASRGKAGGGALLSYLLFESVYTRELIELGYADTMRRTEEVKAFFTEASA